jgi:carboxymethylenebutenolidase
MGKTIEFTRPDGGTAPGYYAAASADAPGVVVIEEWWGVTPWIRQIADAYASLGYRALVPDLYRGRTAAAGDEATHLMQGLNFEDAFKNDVRGAVQYLKQSGKKCGVTGYCMGGALTTLSAMYLDEPDAAVVFYGFPPADAGDPGTIEIPTQFHFAKHDEFFAPERGREVEARLKEGLVPAEVYWYDAKHAFCNPNPPGSAGLGNYDENAAREAWDRTVRFWENTLKQ